MQKNDKMEKSVKITLIITISIVSLAIVFLVVKKIIDRRKQEEEQQQKSAEKKQETEAKKKAEEAQYYIPKTNRNGELINSFSDLQKVKLLAKNAKTNLRTTPSVNNSRGWYEDLFGIFGTSNLLKSVPKGTYLGKLIGEQKGQEQPPMRWLKIELEKPDVTGFKEVWVRADVVTFNKTKK